MSTCQLTEQQIVEGLRDPDALVCQRTEKELYFDLPVNTSVKGYVQRREGNRGQAEEVFDYAFLHFNIRVRDHRYPDPDRLENDWRKTLSNIGYKAWDYKEYGQYKPKPFEEWKESYDPIGPLVESDYQVSIADILDRVDRLGAHCRFILEHELKGYNQLEISELLGISHDSVRQQKTQCLQRLRKLF